MTILYEAAKIAAALSVLCGVVIAVSKSRPGRWLWRRVVSEPAGNWFRVQVEEATAETQHLVRYHLGPNHDTTPLHERVQAAERHANACMAKGEG